MPAMLRTSCMHKQLHGPSGTSRRCSRPCRHVRAACSVTTSGSTFALPTDAQQAATQAQEAIIDAYGRGLQRQRVDLLLPLIGATDIDDWPGGIRQMFSAAQPMVESILKAVKGVNGLEGKLDVTILDEGDAVGAWYSETVLAVLFPTGDVLKRVMEMSDGKKLVLLINPQWQGGQVISDFGLFGRARKEAFVDSFTTTYALESKRMCGEDMRVLQMDGRSQVFVREGNGFTLVDEYSTVPAYFEMEKILQKREGSIASMSLVERLQAEMAFNAESLKDTSGQ